MSKSVQNKHFSGHHGSASQPGTSTPSKLRMWASSGNGVVGEYQRRVNRMFRTTEEQVRPAPHIVHAEDVFKGLNLDTEAEGKLLRVLEGTRSDFGAGSQLRVPRIVHARIRLMDTMRAMKQIDSTTRMEILRRAIAYWKRNHQDYDQPATIRYVARKSMRNTPMIHSLRKGIKPKKEVEEGDYADDPYSGYDDGSGEGSDDSYGGYEDSNGDGGEESYDDEYADEENGDAEDGGGPTHPKDRRVQDFNSMDPQEQAELIQQALEAGEITEEEAQAALDEIEQGLAVDQPVVSAVEAMEEREVDGGRELDFGEDVTAHLPDDADFHHHATEYAKHRAAYQINKDKNPAKADAHKHAANIHASVGNAMHQAGDLERRRLPGSKGDGKAESLQSAEEQAVAGAAPDVGEPEDLPMPGGPLGTDGPGGAPTPGAAPSPRKNIQGGGMPAAPDDIRNAPARDSELEAAKQMSGKLRLLIGKMTAKKKPPLQYNVEMGPAVLDSPRRRPHVEIGPATIEATGPKASPRPGVTIGPITTLPSNQGKKARRMQARMTGKGASEVVQQIGQGVRHAVRGVADLSMDLARTPRGGDLEGGGRRAASRGVKPQKSRPDSRGMPSSTGDRRVSMRGRMTGKCGSCDECEGTPRGKGARALAAKAGVHLIAKQGPAVRPGQRLVDGVPIERTRRMRAGDVGNVRQAYERITGTGNEGRRVTGSGDERAAERGVGGRTVRQEEQRRWRPKAEKPPNQYGVQTHRQRPADWPSADQFNQARASQPQPQQQPRPRRQRPQPGQRPQQQPRQTREQRVSALSRRLNISQQAPQRPPRAQIQAGGGPGRPPPQRAPQAAPQAPQRAAAPPPQQAPQQAAPPPAAVSRRGPAFGSLEKVSAGPAVEKVLTRMKGRADARFFRSQDHQERKHTLKLTTGEIPYSWK